MDMEIYVVELLEAMDMGDLYLGIFTSKEKAREAVSKMKKEVKPEDRCYIIKIKKVEANTLEDNWKDWLTQE